jgi:hypothetical protein
MVRKAMGGGTNLSFGANVEEGPVSSNKMVSDTSSLILSVVSIIYFPSRGKGSLQSRQFDR